MKPKLSELKKQLRNETKYKASQGNESKYTQTDCYRLDVSISKIQYKYRISERTAERANEKNKLPTAANRWRIAIEKAKYGKQWERQQRRKFESSAQ